jgi:glycosyltransferase involved in cell wall biosynthesis
MNGAPDRTPVLMIAYTNYPTDPRVIREAEAAVSGGFDVDFIALRRDGEPPQEFIRGVRLIRLKQTRYRGAGVLRYMLSYLQFFFRCLLKTTWLQARKRYRVVHVNNMPDFFVFCALLPKLMGARIVLDIHDPVPNTFASKFKRGENSLPFRILLWQQRVSTAFADQVVTVHDPVKDHVLVKQHGTPAASIRVIGNFADDDVFTLRDVVQFDGRLRLSFHGTILERYGLRDVMHALTAMKHRHLITVKIIGEGDFSGELKTLIKSLHLSDVVRFDNRMYPVQELPRLLADCNVGLVPLQISSITNYVLPLKLLEYLSMGIPSITVRNTAIGYYFGDDDCLFYEPGNVQSLRAILDRLAANPEILRRYRQRAVALRERFLWSREKQKYIALLRELSGQSQPLG